MTALAVSVGGMCGCGHTDRRHDADGLCAVDNCTCDGLAIDDGDTALIIEPAPAPVIVEKKGSLDALLAEAKRSPFKRTAALAEKIDGLLDDLRDRLDAEAVDAQTMREVADLEAKLAAARAKLRGVPAASAAKVARAARGDATCPDCGKDGLSNVGAHRTKAHGWRKDGAA